LVPDNEVIGKALRRSVPMYPELAVRELVANALIHQDFSVGGAGPMIEIFADRMEVTNPGLPLVDIDRFLDTPPRSRNESLASLLRRFDICEERGSGVDKVVQQTELYLLPAPDFALTSDHTRVTLFAHRSLSKMDKRDRVRACYLHACLRYVERDYMTNTSLRERFGIELQNSATASRYIKEAVEQDKIRPYDEQAGRKYMKYVPHWAVFAAGIWISAPAAGFRPTRAARAPVENEPTPISCTVRPVIPGVQKFGPVRLSRLRVCHWDWQPSRSGPAKSSRDVTH
jgi:ATP-dependent DNA helicase RecG